MSITINDDAVVNSFDDSVLAYMNETGPNVLCGEYSNHPGLSAHAQQDLFECVGVEAGVPLVNGTQTLKWRRALRTSDPLDRDIRTDGPMRLGYSRHSSRRAASGYPTIMSHLTINWVDGAVEPCPDAQVGGVHGAVVVHAAHSPHSTPPSLWHPASPAPLPPHADCRPGRRSVLQQQHRAGRDGLQARVHVRQRQRAVRRRALLRPAVPRRRRADRVQRVQHHGKRRARLCFVHRFFPRQRQRHRMRTR